MTANQINYSRVVEDQRHNRVSEGQRDVELRLQRRSIRATERDVRNKERSTDEAIRHNVEQERINWFDQLEAQRHNYTSEGHKERELSISQFDSDTRRRAQEEQSVYWQTMGQAALKDAESRRMSAIASQIQAQASMYQASIAERRQLEDARHNAKLETLQKNFETNQYQHWIRQDTETSTHNRQMEHISRWGTRVKEEQGAQKLQIDRWAVASNLASSLIKTAIIAGGTK